jgi:phosphopantetheinyl transferase (holo-ACP synthase)
MGWRDLDVRKKESGEPYVVLSGGAEKMAQEQAVEKVWISL